MSKKYTFIEDPGHGWLRVPLSELLASGAADLITTYSYMDGQYAYLEEDQDLGTFADAVRGNQEFGDWWNTNVEREYSGRVRDLPHYSSEKVLQ